MTSHVLLVGGMAEFDQFTPIACALDRYGETLHVLVDESLLGHGDPREALLRGASNVSLHPIRDRKSTRLNSSHMSESRMPSSA